MRSTRMTRALWILLLAFAGGSAGCVAAAAGAGAGGAIYLTSRGAESIVKGSVDAVATQAQAVLEEEGITIDATSTEKSGDKRELKGKKGDLDITVELERKTTETTNAEVTARKNLVEWDKDYAQQLLSKIVAKSGG